MRLMADTLYDAGKRHAKLAFCIPQQSTQISHDPILDEVEI